MSSLVRFGCLAACGYVSSAVSSEEAALSDAGPDAALVPTQGPAMVNGPTGPSGQTWCADHRCPFPTLAPGSLATVATTTAAPTLVGETKESVCCQRFFQCEGESEVYYQNDLSSTKHLLQDEGCPACVEPSMCAAVSVVNKTYCNMLTDGDVFDCSMVLCYSTTPIPMEEQGGSAMHHMALPIAVLSLLALACCAGVAVMYHPLHKKTFRRPMKKEKQKKTRGEIAWSPVPNTAPVAHATSASSTPSLQWPQSKASQADSRDLRCFESQLSQSRPAPQESQEALDLVTVTPIGFDVRHLGHESDLVTVTVEGFDVRPMDASTIPTQVATMRPSSDLVTVTPEGYDVRFLPGGIRQAHDLQRLPSSPSSVQRVPSSPSSDVQSTQRPIAQMPTQVLLNPVATQTYMPQGSINPVATQTYMPEATRHTEVADVHATQTYMPRGTQRSPMMAPPA